MEPSFLPTEPPTFTYIDTQSAVPSIGNVYQALERALTGAQLARSTDLKYIRDQGNQFFTTIDLTLKSSQDGIILAMDALTFFAALENGYDDKALTDYLEGLGKIVRSSLGKARQLNQQFLDNVELIRSIGLKPTKGSMCLAGRVPEAEVSRLRELLSPGRTLWCLSLPFIVPSLTKQLRGTKSEGAKPNNTYEQLGADLDKVRDYLSHLVAWWSEIESQICQTRAILMGHGDPLCRDTLVCGLYQQTWASIKKQHSAYRDQVSMIQDHYPQFNRCSSRSK